MLGSWACEFQIKELIKFKNRNIWKSYYTASSNPPKYDRFTSGVCYACLKITLNFSWKHQVVVKNIVCMKKNYIVSILHFI